MKKTIYYQSFSTLLFLLLGLSVSAQSIATKHPATGPVTPPPPDPGFNFIENKGQWNAEAKYKLNVPGGVMFMTDNGFVYNYISPEDAKLFTEDEHDHSSADKNAGKKESSRPKDKNTLLHFHAYKVTFLGANTNAKFVPEQKQLAYHNYFLGNDKSKWAGHVGLYKKITQQNVYNGIDLTSYDQNNTLKYDFIVAPHADPNQIQLSFTGVTPIIAEDGSLKIKTSVNEVKEMAPYTYQVINGVKKEVPSRYKLSKGILTFEFPQGYDNDAPLIIDPVLVFVTYSGGTTTFGSGFYAYCSTYDALGNMYASSGAYNIGWPTTPGAFQATFNGIRNATINKYNATGSSLIYSTYFGGSNTDFAHAMKVNAAGELVIIGSTNSTDLPITSGCYDNTLNGASDMYVAHFNDDGTNLIGSTYIGGTGTEPTAFDWTAVNPITANNGNCASPMELTFDDSTIWVVGNTTSTDFPVIANNSQNTYTSKRWICQGSSYMFGTQSLTTSGTYTQTFPTSGGCDSVVKLILTVGTQTPKNVTKNICPGQTYTFGTQVLNTTGIYNHTFVSTSGCDSAVILNLNVYPFKTNNVNKSICPGTTYSFGGATLSAAGTYIDTFSTSGCDSIVTLNLSFKPYIRDTTDVNICAGKSYTFGGTVLHTAGIYVDTFSSANCDSIVTLRLTVAPYVTETIQGTFCSGHSYVFGSHTYTAAGTYVDTISSQASCDKIITLQLSQATSSQYHYYESICQGSSYQFGTQTLTTPGIYSHTFTTSSCDSAVTIHLEYRPNITNAVAAYICPGGSYTFGTQTLTTAGTYTHTFPTAGCDSTVTLTLNINPATNDTISKNICQGTSFVFGPDTILTAGTYTHTFPSAIGCDSTVTVHLTFDPYITHNIVDSVCYGGTYTFGNQQLNTAGTYINVFPTSGCDSVVTLTLSIISIDTFTYTENYCSGSNYYFGGQPITAIGTYFHTFQAASGCDSIVRLVLTGPWHHSDSLSGGVDVVLFRLNQACTQLYYGGYLGGSGDDSPTGMIFNSAGNLVISGLTHSSDFPVTAGSMITTQPGGYSDGFVSIINPHYGNMAASTYLGTTANDQATHVQVDALDNVYILGRTEGTYPITTGVWTGATDGDIFIDELTPQLTSSIRSTRLGNSNSGNGSILGYFPSAFLVDICRNVYVAGYYADGNQPLSLNAQQTTPASFWFGVLEPDMTGLLYGSYFGVNGDHNHCGISRMDPNGIVYHSICNASINYPGTTANSYAPSSLVTSGQDIVSFKFNFEATGVHSNFELAPGQNDTGCAPFTVAFHNTSNSAISYEWNFGDGSAISNATDPTHIYTDTGTFKVSLVALNPNTCITNDTSYYTIRVVRAVLPNITVHDTVLCAFTNNIDLHVTVNNPTDNNTFKWGPSGGVVSGGTTATATVDPTANSVYYVTVKDTIPGICGFSSTDSVHIDLAPRVLHIITPDTAVCQGTVIQIQAEGTPAYNYIWTPSDGVSDTSILEPTITVEGSNIYTVTGKYYACPDTTVTLKIEMQAYPHLTMASDKAVCQGTDVILESSVVPYRSDYIYQWTPATPNLTNPTGPNTHFIADTSIVYHLNIQTPIGCSDDDSISVTVFPIGFGSIISDTGYCPGNQAPLWANGGNQYSWTPAEGLSDPNIANPIASPTTTTQYVVYITDVHNCKDTERVTVSVYPDAVLNMPDSINVYPGEQYHLEPATNALYFSWFPPSGVSDVNSSNPVLSPTVRTRYFVTAKTESGCVIKDSIDVIVKETVIDMPNAFAPNGGNNLFKPSKRGIATLREFAVYNRWGNKVYSSTNIDEGWDGTYNGKPQPMGVFVYTIDAVTDSGRVFTQKGNVTLVR